MGNIHTFIIKIYWDRNQPLALQGQLTCVANGEKYAFAEGKALLELLRRILNQEAVDLSSPITQEAKNENQR
jgi:hypothetical protein